MDNKRNKNSKQGKSKTSTPRLIENSDLQNIVLQVENLCKSFKIETSFIDSLKNRMSSKKLEVVQALSQISFQVNHGETLGILGESGSGKSTLARVLMGIYRPDSGSAYLLGKNVSSSCEKTRMDVLRNMQMIFQDPFGSLDPRMNIRQIICEPLKIHKIMPDKEKIEIFLNKSLEDVGLDASALGRYPGEFSGGQRQRIGICRALMLNPSLLIADEAVSALDVSVQAQVLELLARLRNERNLAMLFISHDIAVVRQISDRIILLFKGHLVEELPADSLLKFACHPYSLHLLKAALYLREGKEKDSSILARETDRSNMSDGCCYQYMCPKFQEKCKIAPELREISPRHRVACYFV